MPIKDWFKSPVEPTSEPVQSLAKYDAEAVMRAACLAAEPAVLARAPELAKAHAKIYAADRRAYAFECKRHGDFLALYLTRLAARYHLVPTGDFEPQQTVTSISLLNVTRLSLALGHAPDKKGEVRYELRWVGDKSDSGSSGAYYSSHLNHISEFYRPRPGSQILATPYAFPAPTKVHPAVRDATAPNNIPRGYWPVLAPYATENFPRPAEDDRITFVGSSVELYAPAGLGRGVYDQLLAALATKPRAKRQIKGTAKE